MIQTCLEFDGLELEICLSFEICHLINFIFEKED
jgi:hypothetical protein